MICLLLIQSIAPKLEFDDELWVLDDEFLFAVLCVFSLWSLRLIFSSETGVKNSRKRLKSQSII